MTSRDDTAPSTIRLRVAASTVTATLADTETARAFAALPPLTLVLEDFHGTEKISDLPARLTTAGAPAGHTPVRGDLAYYAPWGNFANFDRDFGYSAGLIHLGHIDAEALD